MSTTAAVWGRAEQQDYRSRVRGCLLGTAIGDALGAGVAHLAVESIRAAHGADGLTDLAPPTGAGAPSPPSHNSPCSPSTG